MGSGYSSANSRKWSKKEAPNPESSRILFLLYLIHRTWNVVVEHMDSKSGRWRGSHTVPSSGEGLRHFDSVSLDSGGSCFSGCSCSYCRLRDCAQDCIRYLSNKFVNGSYLPPFEKHRQYSVSAEISQQILRMLWYRSALCQCALRGQSGKSVWCDLQSQSLCNYKLHRTDLPILRRLQQIKLNVPCISWTSAKY